MWKDVSAGKMQFKNKNRSVFTAFSKDERAFTLISMLMGLSFLAMTLPFLIHTLQTVRLDSHYEELSIQQFFTVMRMELLNTKDVTVENGKTKISYEVSQSQTSGTPEIATIELYNNLVRRQVEGLGHEVYLRNIKTISFERISHGIHVTILGIEGGLYEKSIILYGR